MKNYLRMLVAVVVLLAATVFVRNATASTTGTAAATSGVNFNGTGGPFPPGCDFF